jgi:choline-sulfatase
MVRPKNVLLLIVDTLRTDRVGVYGSPRPTTPNLDALAARGLRYDRAYATSPWTMPTVASVLTGLMPASHGVTHVRRKIPDAATTLAELLKDQGFETTGIVGNVLLTEEHGFQQGFDHYDTHAANGHRHVSTPQVVDSAVRALERHAASDAPFFLMAHFFDPHYDYLPHEGVDWAKDSAGRLDTSVEIVQIRDDRASLTPEEVRFLGDLYDEEVWFTDQGIGQILATLDRLNLTEDTLVIALADHGEELMEHGWLGHTRSMYEEVVRVPLILAGPGIPSAAVMGTPVSLAAVTPTVLDRLGIAPGWDRFQAPPLPIESPPSPGAVFIEVDFVPVNEVSELKRGHLTAIVGDRLKAIRDEDSDKLEIYDLAADPREHHDRSAEDPKQAAFFRQVLDRAALNARERPMPPESMDLDDAKKQQLRDLGYLE